MKLIKYLSALALILTLSACNGSSTDNEHDDNREELVVEVEPTLLYDIDIEGYEIATDTIRSGETVGGILGRRFFSVGQYVFAASTLRMMSLSPHATIVCMLAALQRYSMSCLRSRWVAGTAMENP